MKALWLLTIWLLVLAPARSHEGPPVPANTRTSLRQLRDGLELGYQVRFERHSARTEWGEIDRDGDGKLSEEEKSLYLSAEEAWFYQPLRLQADGQEHPLPGISSYSLEGHPDDLILHLSWHLRTPARDWQVEVVGAGNFTGQHQLHVDLAAAPQKAEFHPPRLELQLSQTSGNPWTQQWDWDNRAGELQAALENQSLWAGLVMAFLLGGVHALTPGHGKTIVGAYLIGSRGTIGHAILLGVVVTLTHTSSVILLGLICLWFFQSYLPPALIPWVGVLSGILIAALGLSLLTRQVPTFLHHHHHDDDHDHHHHHHHHHGHHHHHHHVPEKLSLKGLISLGVSGGMVPCPEALAVLLTALALNKVLLGLIILVAFSAGLAAVLVAIGILMVTASKLFEKRYPSSGTISRLSDISYIFLTLMGLVIALRAMWQVLFP